jgi:hypothetical protein
LVVFVQVNGQDRREAKHLNEVRLRGGYVLYADDRVVIAEKDTIILLPLNVDFYIKKGEKEKGDQFYAKMQQSAYKNRWTTTLHNIVIAPSSSSEPVKDTLQTEKSEVPFLPYRNIVIRNITYKKLSVFGPSISNPDGQPKNWVHKTGNKLHVKTADWVLNSHLLIKKGDLIDPYVLADNERILRDLAFIEDVQVNVKNISVNSDSADVEILIKDKWSKGFDLNLDNLNQGYVELWNSNILGTGQENSNYYYWNPSGKPVSGWDGHYKMTNIGGTFINGQVGYSLYGSKGYNIDLSRNFYTQSTKYAGGLFYEKLETFNSISTIDSSYFIPISYRKCNFWLGRSFPLKRNVMTATSKANLVLSGAVYFNLFNQRPLVDSSRFYPYHNKTYYLGSIAYSNLGYYKTNLVYNFGRAEDIPYGLLVKYTSGFEVNEFFNRMYNSIKISVGNSVTNVGFYYSSVAFGGFFHKDNFEQGILQLKTTFVTNLLVYKQYKFRHFFSVNFTRGYKRFDDEYLSINSDVYGVRSLNYNEGKGTQKLSLNYEVISFTPMYLLGFRVAIFGFVDLGLIGVSYTNVLSNPLYSGMGLGVRFRNEKLVFKTFQIRFAYYPLLPEQAAGELFSITDSPKFRPYDFYSKSPEILQFK